MEVITPKRVVGVHHDPTKFFTIRICYTEGMQEFLCPDGEKLYKQSENRNKKIRENLHNVFTNRLAADSEEQLRYNNVVNSILDFKDYDEYKRKTSFKYRVLRFLKLTK